jgi:carbon-monoxide dehydrogenase large subunit
VAQARDAAEAIDVRYEPLPVVTATVAAVAQGAPLVWSAASGNVAAEIRHGSAAAAAAAFARAEHVVALELVNQRVAPCPIEPRAVLASYDAPTDRITLRVSCQTPTGLRDALCNEVLGIPPEKVRVRVGDVGGGFGMKTGLYPEDVVVAFCAREFKRPVRWRAERIEEFLAATHGRDVTSQAELALDASGRILALRVSSLANLGAYATPAGVVIQLMIGPWVSTSIYDIGVIDIRIQGVLTHTAPTSAYRGAGRPEAIYIIERLMDAAARKLGMDPRELRRRNMIRPEQMPYTNAMHQTYDSGQFEAVMDKAVALARWDEFDARAAEAKQRGPRHGDFPRMDRRGSLRGAGHSNRERRGGDRDLPCAAAYGPGTRDDIRPGGRRRLWRPDREDQDCSGRHRPRDRLRQRGLTLAVRGRLGGARGRRAHGRQGAAACG